MSKRTRQPGHPFLAQMLFRYVGQGKERCQAVTHQQDRGKPPLAEWELRIYQNPNRVVDLYQQEVSREEIAQRSWDEACREQDTIGIRVHMHMPVCSVCATFIINNHAGEESGFLSITTAQITQGALLLVSDRLTEYAGIVGNVPGTIQEQDILPLLDKEDMLDIRFKV